MISILKTRDGDLDVYCTACGAVQRTTLEKLGRRNQSGPAVTVDDPKPPAHLDIQGYIHASCCGSSIKTTMRQLLEEEVAQNPTLLPIYLGI